MAIKTTLKTREKRVNNNNNNNSEYNSRSTILLIVRNKVHFKMAQFLGKVKIILSLV